MAEFKHFSEQQPAFKLLKPWWDVLAEYLTVAMLMIGVFGCTLQVRGGARLSEGQENRVYIEAGLWACSGATGEGPRKFPTQG